MGTYQGVKASTATIFMDIPMDGSSANATSVLSLSIKVSVFQEEGFVKLGSRKFAVDTGKLAITYTILDWPFESYDNTLVLRSSIETPSAGGSMSGNELFLFNGASWTFSPTAAIPAPYDSSPVTVKSSNTDSGVDTNVQFYATSSITYDTLWSVETATSSAPRLTSFPASSSTCPPAEGAIALPPISTPCAATPVLRCINSINSCASIIYVVIFIF